MTPTVNISSQSLRGHSKMAHMFKSVKKQPRVETFQKKVTNKKNTDILGFRKFHIYFLTEQ